MVRTVKAKAVRTPHKDERAVLLPGTTGAEAWEVWILGPTGKSECVQICQVPRDRRFRGNTVLALPVSEVFCLPIWLNETDPKQFSGLLPLQLELRGLQPRGTSFAVFDYSVIIREETRTLVTVGILPASLSKEVLTDTSGAFDLSARYLPLPENAFTIWQEQDCLVVAVTRGAALLYFQSLGRDRLTPSVLQDLHCIRAMLMMQEFLPSLEQVVLWTEVESSEFTALQSTFQLPVQKTERPAPRIPPAPWKLVPPAVHEAKRNREVRRWRNRILLAALVIYLLVVVALLSRLFITSQKIAESRRWQADQASSVALVHETQAAWKELRPVVDEDGYPLELLLHCSDAIPTDQLHFTLFEVGDGHILIKGEAKNVAAAFQFADRLKADPHLSGYTWEMGQPHLLPNDLAQLQIEGTRGPAN